MAKLFELDQNLCIGCSACVLGCQFENSGLESNWREVRTFNKIQIPDLAILNYSMACNHCEQAPCMKNCPALAYSRDLETGAVIIDQKKCIGCKYCTWNCPFDAPQYNEYQGVIEKCHFCNEKLQIGEDPACISACVTGALKYKEVTSTENTELQGFEHHDIKPSIRIIPNRISGGPKMYKQHADREDVEFVISNLPPIPSKIDAKKEWSLLVFTAMLPLLIGLYIANVFGVISITSLIYMLIVAIPTGLSTLHLGRKERAWRAILNIKSSWLSREILFFSVFTALSVCDILNVIPSWISYLAITSGVLTLLSAEMLYKPAINRHKLHSSSLLMSGLLYYSIFTGNPSIFLIVLFLKTALYFYRKFIFLNADKSIEELKFIIMRIGIGVVIPIFSYYYFGDLFHPIALISVVAGELIDRYEFYEEIDIINQEHNIRSDIQNHFTNRKES